jgi:hypothetical protein
LRINPTAKAKKTTNPIKTRISVLSVAKEYK